MMLHDCLTTSDRSSAGFLRFDAGALTDQPLTHAVERLQVELLGGLCRDELHRRALHRLGDRLRFEEVIFCPLE